jgi:wyosine [tRNA(Phe)-imidazoG37] synthetase (radical SAM superfamily)
MRFVIQRVNEASVKVDNKEIGSINKGFLVLIGVSNEDTKEIVDLVPQKKDIEKELKEKLILFKENGTIIDSITFSGNGEPTLHPEFCEIIDMVVQYRNLYAPKAKISVLSNATNLLKDDILAWSIKISILNNHINNFTKLRM